MRVVNNGNRYDLYNNSINTYDKLPTQVYSVGFDKMTGLFLEKSDDINVSEKVYGKHVEKVDKVLNTYKVIERNLGVILSGDKGIGKTLFVKMLSKKAIENGYPIIIVNKYYNGIANYIERINQSVVILFDEFDKTFSSERNDDMNSPQTEMLTLFDGLSQGKKLFVITCNNLYKLNDCIVNRPGRFHYHFRFEYPKSEEIRVYMENNIDKRYYCEIDKVIKFSRTVNLNYDCLRAIAFELNQGATLKMVIKDLNIIKSSNTEYDITVHFKNGNTVTRRRCDINLYNTTYSEELYIKGCSGKMLYIEFNASNIEYNKVLNLNIILASNLDVRYDDDIGNYENELDDLEYLSIRPSAQTKCHYDI